MSSRVMGTAHVIRANARSLPLADNSVDLVVTSPPYFALRSYQDGGTHYRGQIGDEPTPAEFVDSLIKVTRECVRVLKSSGSLWVNLGDKYAGHTGGDRAPLANGGGQGSPSVKRTIRGAAPKSLIGIPWRYALRCIDDLGLILRAEVIWSKPNGLPESVTDRVRRSHEQWFHFTLQSRYFSAVDEIREQYNQEQHARGQAPNGANPLTGGAPTNHLRNALGKLPGSVWVVPTEPLSVPADLGVDHFAAFPSAWPKRIIAGWSPAGVCVECGEGRRPVTAPTGETGRHPGGQRREDKRTYMGLSEAALRVREIAGYTCACGTLTGDTWTTARTTSSGTPTPPLVTPAPSARSADGRATGDAPAAPNGKCSSTSAVTAAPQTRPAVVLDPFGGTGTTALVAKALGRTGISVDMSADYCRLAEWRTNDRNQLAKVLGVEKAPAPDLDQLDLFGGGAA